MTGAEYLASPFRYDEGWVDYLSVTQPSAGANAKVPVPGDFGMQVLGARAKLTTSAAVANRFVSIDYVNANAVTFLRNPSTVAIAAGQTNVAVEFNSQWTLNDHGTGSANVVPVLPLLLNPGWVIQFTVDAIDVGDQLSGLVLVVLKVPTGAQG